MKKFKERANKKIQEAIQAILNDAKFEIKRNPQKEDEINNFCIELMRANSDFFKNYNKDIER